MYNLMLDLKCSITRQLDQWQKVRSFETDEELGIRNFSYATDNNSSKTLMRKARQFIESAKLPLTLTIRSKVYMSICVYHRNVSSHRVCCINSSESTMPTKHILHMLTRSLVNEKDHVSRPFSNYPSWITKGRTKLLLIDRELSRCNLFPTCKRTTCMLGDRVLDLTSWCNLLDLPKTQLQ